MEQMQTYLAQAMRFYREHEKIVQTAVILLIVIAAVFLFGGYGKEEELSVTSEEEVPDTGFAVSEAGIAAADEPAKQQEEPAPIFVDITGEVKNPGVYQVKEGARVFDVIAEAGGLLSSAETGQINQAEQVSDGQKIIIPKAGAETGIGEISTGVGADGRININSADSAALQEIPGVGPATAEKIIAYRTANGRFKKKEDLKNVSGIGDKTFEKLKDSITV